MTDEAITIGNKLNLLWNQHNESTIINEKITNYINTINIYQKNNQQG